MDIPTMKSIVAQLTERQAVRLLNSHASAEDFMRRPEEEAVTFEIECYENLIEKSIQAA
jgi:hypothetical protein